MTWGRNDRAQLYWFIINKQAHLVHNLFLLAESSSRNGTALPWLQHYEAPVPSRSPTHPSHSPTSLLSTSSLSLSIPVPHTTPHWTDTHVYIFSLTLVLSSSVLWLIGVFIDTQTFSVYPYKIDKTLSSGQARSSKYSRLLNEVFSFNRIYQINSGVFQLRTW